MSYIPLVTAGVFLLLLLLERIDPLRQAKHWWVERLAINFCITALAFGVNATLVQPAASFMLQWTQVKSFGLMPLLDLPVWMQSAIAFLLMDLTFYYWHRATHRFPLLWRFHNVHHVDPDLDVSTGFRFHFIEIAFSTGFRILQVALIGVSAWVYAIYELVFQANTLFHHSNVKLPLWLELWLNLVLVTPRMHGIHHSQVQQETNSNYSVVFPWWDRLHRTLRLNVPQAEITIGIPAYSGSEENKLQHLLLMPFQPQCDYWRSADNITVERNLTVLKDDVTQMVDSEDLSVHGRDRQERYS
ncbi:sterol desaturase family protein [Gloeocapsopsis crepidinum LEGE 06123]|uniref:Sterol desaturase family protein n=1 Tax=Gloeocapsopsis crepidinum LEGE 06123 TaxID=588587 RepID=A0ABR9UY04_9CHRO|nr:sterol desaturase family protein [Gloeocapsopsis crepidinum]MBE9193182.1 sterol desaturase family protein [Gloeocapsopsis crepidinum LEGE 06123]